MNFLANPIHTCIKSLPQSRHQTSENFPILVEGFLSPLCIHPPTPVPPQRSSDLLSVITDYHAFSSVSHKRITVFSLLQEVSFPRHVFEPHPCCCMPMVQPLSLVSSSIQGCVTVWLFIQSSQPHWASSLTHRSTGSLGTRRGVIEAIFIQPCFCTSGIQGLAHEAAAQSNPHTSNDGELIPLGNSLFHPWAAGPVRKPFLIFSPTHLPSSCSQRS